MTTAHALPNNSRGNPFVTTSVTILAALLLAAAPLAAQAAPPGLVVPVPRHEAIRVAVDSFTATDGRRMRMDVYRDPALSSLRPVVIFANANGPAMRAAPGYVDWATLVATRGFVGVNYEGPQFDPTRTPQQNNLNAIAMMDSVTAALGRRGNAHGLDIANLVVWAGSAQTFAGTPFALEGTRQVRGYVLYYGAGNIGQPRLDVPVLIARAGHDSPAFNRLLDTLSAKLVREGVQVTLLNHPAGAHGFDIIDAGPVTEGIIEETLAFIARVTTTAHHQQVAANASKARAAAAYSAARWADASRLYGELAREAPNDRIIAWRLGLAQLENREHAQALASFDRAKALGQGGARDIGLPATRAALRAGNRQRAVEWLQWALTSFSRIRPEVEADAELAPLLQDPAVRVP